VTAQPLRGSAAKKKIIIFFSLGLGACRAAQPVPAAVPVARAALPKPAAADARDDRAARAEAAWARRETDPGAVDQAIVIWEDQALRNLDPQGPLLKAARARRLRAVNELRTADSAESLAAVAQDALVCAGEAHRSWTAQFPNAAAQLDGTREAAQIFAQVGAGAAEALYLEAVCTAAWARAQGFTPLIERRVELEEELKRVAQLAPALDGAGADRELGALFAALPPYAGGDLGEARKRLEAAVQRAPDDARNRLQLARTVAVKGQDRELFEKQLQAVVRGGDPAAAAEAAALLSREDDLFGPAQAAQPTPGGEQKK